MAVPNIFATQSGSIPLSQLDNNFATPITIGNTAVTLGNTITTLYNMTLGNVIVNAGTLNNVSVANATAITVAGNITANSYTATVSLVGSANVGAFNYGNLTYSDTGIAIQTTGNLNSFIQHVVQNSNVGAVASSDYIVNNNLSTATTYYGDFGMNSSGFSGSGSLNLPNAVYMYSTSVDLVIGTTTANNIHFVVNNGTTDALTLNGTSGNITTGVWNATAIGAAYGGTGLTTLTANNVLIGNGAGNVTFVAPGTSGNVLQSNGTAFVSAALTVSSPADGYMRNRIHNGAMQIYQRSIQTVTTTGGYTLDRWLVTPTGASVTVSQSTASPPNGQQYYLSVAAAASVSNCNVAQRVESKDCADMLNGTTVTVSGYIYQNTGSSVATATINLLAATSADSTYTTVAATAYAIPSIATGTWTAFTNTFTLTSSCINGVELRFSLGGALTTGVFGLTAIQLEYGSAATPFERLSISRQLLQCQRFFETTYNSGIAPGSSGQNFLGDFEFITSNTTYPPLGYFMFQVAKRASPTISGFNPSSGAVSTFYDYSAAAANGSLSTQWINTRAFQFTNLSASWTVGHLIGMHFTISADL
jgi:hypothetical protein